jgi:hypothetical protein
MDLTTTTSRWRSGRRRALAGLVAGTATLLSGGARTEAHKKHKKHCPQMYLSRTDRLPPCSGHLPTTDLLHV